MKVEKWYKVHCGQYRHFQVKANNPDQAKERFGRLSKVRCGFITKGFTLADVTHVTE